MFKIRQGHVQKIPEPAWMSNKEPNLGQFEHPNGKMTGMDYNIECKRWVLMLKDSNKWFRQDSSMNAKNHWVWGNGIVTVSMYQLIKKCVWGGKPFKWSNLVESTPFKSSEVSSTNNVTKWDHVVPTVTLRILPACKKYHPQKRQASLLFIFCIIYNLHSQVLSYSQSMFTNLCLYFKTSVIFSGYLIRYLLKPWSTLNSSN